MRILVTKDYEEMSQVAAAHLLKHLYKADKRRVNIAVTAGKTPLRMYELITPLLADKPELAQVHYYNFDEIPILGEEAGITMRNMNRCFFEPARVAKTNIHVLNENNVTGYDRVLEADGGLDLLMMGLGEDGHFCGNLAGTVHTFDEETHAVKLSDYPHVDQRVSRYYVDMPDQKPPFYVTFGAKTVMNCREIVMIASGSEKAEIIKKVLFGPMDTAIPSTVFRLHPNFTLIVDAEAASLCRSEISKLQ